MKTAISIPDPLYRRAESLARRMRLSRSALYAAAVSRYMHEQRNTDITARLNDLYSKDTADSRLPIDVAAMQFVSIEGNSW